MRTYQQSLEHAVANEIRFNSIKSVYRDSVFQTISFAYDKTYMDVNNDYEDVVIEFKKHNKR